MASIPVSRTTTVLAPTYRVATRARVRGKSNLLTAAVAFLGLTYASFSAASLAGSVLTEQARREGIQAMARTRAARMAEATIAAQVDELKSLRVIDQWARQNGFVAADRGLDSSMTRGRGKTQP